MLTNRSIPPSTVIPQLVYPDVSAAAKWLCEAFGFTVRVRIGDHRIQLNVGDGAIVVMEGPASESRATGVEKNRSEFGHVMVRVKDANRHQERAIKHGAIILRPPADYPYGERQYTAQDFAGHRWTFSQSIADVAPESWGGTSEQL
jgi:uncharacterized glyoxalase superfamily protein PhnB